MFCLRRVALRALSSSPSPVLFAAKPRSITTLTPSILRQPRFVFGSQLQKRFASDEAKEVTESEAAAEEVLSESPEESAAVAAATKAAAAEAAAEVPSSMAFSASDTSSSAEADGPGYRRRPDSSSPAAEPSNTVYVGNLFFDVTEEDLKREFSRFGAVESVRIIYDGRGLSKGFGYVEMGAIDGATEVIANLNQQVFEGRRMTVQFSHGRKPASRGAGVSERTPHGSAGEPTKTLFIGNMSFEMSDQDLNDMFKDIKNVIDVRVAIDRKTGQPRGFAHADFIDVASAEKAFDQLASKEAYGRKLRIDYSIGAVQARRPRD